MTYQHTVFEFKTQRHIFLPIKLNSTISLSRNKRRSRQINPVLKITELMFLLMLTVQVT